jgi:hypothetical protein
MSIKNYTTEIDVWKTVGEIMQTLAKVQASHVNVKYDGSLPIAISFSLDINGQPFNFLLPCNPGGVQKFLNGLTGQERARANKAGVFRNLEDRSLRIAWRTVKDWIDAQIAFIQAEQASLATVFLPYMVNAQGETLAQKLLSGSGLKQIGY